MLKVIAKSSFFYDGQPYKPTDQLFLDESIVTAFEKQGLVDRVVDIEKVEIDYTKLSVSELKNLLKERNLPTQGKKQELIERLSGD